MKTICEPPAPTMSRYQIENEYGEQISAVLCEDCAAEMAIDCELTVIITRTRFGGLDWYCGKVDGGNDLICINE